MSHEWSDERARQLYLTATEARFGEERKEAIKGLGRLARNSVADAAWALGDLARNARFAEERLLANQELSK